MMRKSFLLASLLALAVCGGAAAAPAENGRILIAYFTWADNTHVAQPEDVDLDASTSASVLPPGNTAKIAQWIREVTGGDLFSIVTEEPYSSDYDQCLERASDELGDGARPALRGALPDVGRYDVVFLGYPNWWGTVPMALMTFLDRCDLSGKTVIPFCAHGTGGMGRSLRDLRRALPDSRILEAVGVYRPETDRSEGAVRAWLEALGFSPKN